MKERLGDAFDVALGLAPVDLQSAQTGNRIRLRHADGVTVIVAKAAGTAGDDPTFTLKQHTASSGGTSANLATITRYHVRSGVTTLAGTTLWSTITQAAAATIADPGGAGLSAESQQLLAFTVLGAELADGYEYMSVDVADVGGNAQLGSIIYILHDLQTRRAPAKMPAPLNG